MANNGMSSEAGPQPGSTPGSTPGSNPDDSTRGLEANFSTLVLSIGSSAAMALGLAPQPGSSELVKDLDLARFNIDLLRMLREKTKGNLLPDEQHFIDSITTDLQMKYVQAK